MYHTQQDTDLSNKLHKMIPTNSLLNVDMGSKLNSPIKIDKKLSNDLDHREASRISPFKFAKRMIKEKIKQENQVNRTFLYNFFHRINNEEIHNVWHSMNRIDQCSYLIKGFYQIPDWSNTNVTKVFENESLGTLTFSLANERLRIYNYCFLQDNGMNDKETNKSHKTHQPMQLEKVMEHPVFNNTAIGPDDFNNRMFPFLNVYNNKKNELLWPTVYELISGNNNVLPKPDIGDLTVEEFNKNFWYNWKKFSKGKGIVVTMTRHDGPMFFRQLKTFKELNNQLPIQIITTGKEVRTEFMKEISDYARELNQKVYLVDLSKLLNEEFTKNHVANFMHKWIADMFNTFEEAIFIDFDAVSFVPMENYFEIDSYKQTGMLLYRDRNLVNEHTFQRCVDLLRQGEPSKDEISLASTKLMFDVKWSKLHGHDSLNSLNSTEAQVYQKFFHKLHLHHIDSGLVVFNKKNKINGLLTSFFLNLDARLSTCVYGDKEITWLGELMAGEEYSIEPMEGGNVGPLNANDGKYSICATQIAHINSNNKLMWTNGGLKTCKFYDTAVNDFANNEKYFKSRYNDPTSLQRVYDSSLVIDAVIVPEAVEGSWMQIDECRNYMYCSFAEDKTEKRKGKGHLVKYGKEDRILFKKISELWNKNTD